MRHPSRRAVLGLLGAAGATGLAGCTASSRTTGASSRVDTSPSASAPGSSASAGPTSASTTSAARPTYDQLSRELTRPLLRPTSAGYAATARLYNPRFDRSSPAAVAPVTSTQDVARCVRFAAEAGVPFALRAGGHSYGGWSSTTGLQIDTAGMNGVVIDRTARRARIGAGARLIDVYSALGNAGLALAAGSCPTVGLTGLSAGGGVGVLTRAFGLTCDSLNSAQVVTADGAVRTVDATHDGELFWALRGGGGGSFGAVTSQTFALQAAPTVQTFFYAFPFSRAAEVLDAWQQWLPTTNTQLWSTCKLLTDPQSGGATVTVSGTWIGPASQLAGQLAPLLNKVGAPSATNTNSLSYLQAMLLEAGCSGQNASSCVTGALSVSQRLPFAATSSVVPKSLPSAAIDTAVAQVQKASALSGLKEGGVSFDALGGAVATQSAAATAFPYRSALALVQYTATWIDPAAPTAPFDTYVRGFRAAMRPWLGTAAYVNYADASITDYGNAYWASNYARLQQVKKKYDPDSLFTFPQAVKPA